MKPLFSFIVSAKLPDSLHKIKELAYNYRWSWDNDCKELFRKIDWKIWEQTHHNPIELINHLSQERVLELAEQSDFISYFDLVYDRFQKYMKSKSWFSNLNSNAEGFVAYFSMEYGIHESFPNYSGGLGILSGDHLKSSS